ncbi:MAG TPA: sulfatase-like hydrolase/transferase, partial [Desulfuromonadaceae bacterium]|nr:sulfatase-like hydrolase/transferase [Desulfuromonadaceae bacterium]
EPVFPPLKPVSPGQPRVLWIIFDELDYRLAFEQPPPAYQFPELARFERESFSATNVVAPADRTVLSMPSLIAGRRVQMAALTNSYNLILSIYQTGSVVNVENTTFRDLPNAFSDAHARGVNTAVIGWYLPYSRLLSTNLNYCAWHAYPNFEPTRSPSYLESLWNQVESLAGPLHIQHLFIKMYRQNMDKALMLVTNADYGLTLLHFNPPHSPGFYLPAQDRYSLFPETGTKAYFNNIVLVDHTLGHLRQAMESAGEWDKTWVIVSADHSWRMSHTFDGKRDFRVPFIIKPPGPSSPMIDSQEFNSVVTKHVITAVFDREITNTESLSGWLTAHAHPRPTSHGKFIEGKYSE